MAALTAALTLAPDATSNAPPQNNNVIPRRSGDSDDDGDDGWKIAAVILAASIVVLIAVVLIVWRRSKHSAAPAAAAAHTTEVPTQGPGRSGLHTSAAAPVHVLDPLYHEVNDGAYEIPVAHNPAYSIAPRTQGPSSTAYATVTGPHATQASVYAMPGGSETGYATTAATSQA